MRKRGSWVHEGPATRRRLQTEDNGAIFGVRGATGQFGAPPERHFVMQIARTHRKSVTNFWFLLAGLLLLATCPVTAGAATKVVTDADKGGTVALKMGDVLEVRLSSNPSTGFAWYLQKQSTALLKLTGQSQTQPTQPGPAQPEVGRPVVQIFDFAPKATGTGVLLLHYVRSWESPHPDDEQFALHVTIE
jgi:inhibitor of cysteine peptidase